MSPPPSPAAAAAQVLNSPALRSAECPSFNGHATAKALAKIAAVRGDFLATRRRPRNTAVPSLGARAELCRCRVVPPCAGAAAICRVISSSETLKNPQQRVAPTSHGIPRQIDCNRGLVGRCSVREGSWAACG